MSTFISFPWLLRSSLLFRFARSKEGLPHRTPFCFILFPFAVIWWVLMRCKAKYLPGCRVPPPWCRPLWASSTKSGPPMWWSTLQRRTSLQNTVFPTSTSIPWPCWRCSCWAILRTCRKGPFLLILWKDWKASQGICHWLFLYASRGRCLLPPMRFF